MNCNTQKGLYFLIIGTIITMIYGIISSVSSFLSEDLMNSIQIGSLIIALPGAIMVLIGLILFLMGRKEFGEKHQKNVMNAVLIFVINFVVVIILTSAITYFTVISMTSSSTENIAGPFSIFLIIIVIISAILGGLMYYFALIELEDERGKNILLAGIISSIIVSIITSLYLSGILGDFLGTISTTSNYSSLGLSQNVGKISIIGFIPTLFYLYAFYIPYNRIKNGELIPQVPSQSSVPSRICPNCNKNIPDDATLCPYCGKRFETYL